MTQTLKPTEDPMPRITGAATLRLLSHLKLAIDDSGTGEMRALKFLTKLAELGLDVVAREVGQEPLVSADQLDAG